MTQSRESAAANSPREAFERLVGGISEGRWGELADLYAEDAVVEQPLAKPPVPARIEGRTRLREHFAATGSAAGGLEFGARDVVVHETTDPEVIVAEFVYRGRTVATDRPFAAPCVFVMRVRDGLIVTSHDYVDHGVLAEAMGS